MKITVLRKMEYERHLIYIMHFSNVFQYLFADKNKNIYQHHITLPRNLFRLLKYKLGLSTSAFTKDELETGEKVILSGAMMSIDALLKAEEKKTKELKATSRLANAIKKDKRCMWRAIETNDGRMSYQCLIHDVLVPMEDGVTPFHEITKDSKVLSPLQFES